MLKFNTALREKQESFIHCTHNPLRFVNPLNTDGIVDFGDSSLWKNSFTVNVYSAYVVPRSDA